MERVFSFYFPAQPLARVAEALEEFGGAICPWPNLEHLTELFP
jgi:hypothetical protein